MRSALFCGCSMFSLLALSACATTSGQSWVREPVDTFSESDAAYAARDLEPLPQAPAPATLDASAQRDRDAADDAHPRLSHVVSLGQTESAATTPPTAAAAAGSPGVVVNVNNYVHTPYASGYGYGYGYGYAPSYRGGATSFASPSAVTTRAASSGGTPALGGDWGRTPSYGPSFPWHTGPAPAFERSR